MAVGVGVVVLPPLLLPPLVPLVLWWFVCVVRVDFELEQPPPPLLLPWLPCEDENPVSASTTPANTAVNRTRRAVTRMATPSP